MQEDTSAEGAIEAVPESTVQRIFEQQARRLLNMSGEEFTRLWQRGEFAADSNPRVTQVAMLMPSAW